MYLLNLETISKGICRLLASLKIPLDIFLPIALPAGAACLPAIQFAGFLYSYTHCFMYISWFFFAFSTPVTSPTFHFSAALFFQPMFAYVNRNVWRPEWGALCIYAHANIPFFSSHMCNAALFNIKWRLIPGSTSILRGKGQVQHQNGRVVCDMSDIYCGVGICSSQDIGGIGVQRGLMLLPPHLIVVHFPGACGTFWPPRIWPPIIFDCCCK